MRRRPTSRPAGSSNEDATHRTYLAADGETVVGEGDPRANSLLTTPGRPIPEKHLDAVKAFQDGAPSPVAADDTEPAPSGPSSDDGAETGTSGSETGSGGDGPFDPTAHKVEEVLEYLNARADAGDDDEVLRVLEAERASAKPRKGIVG